jgi:hypothetical protein
MEVFQVCLASFDFAKTLLWSSFFTSNNLLNALTHAYLGVKSSLIHHKGSSNTFKIIVINNKFQYQINNLKLLGINFYY